MADTEIGTYETGFWFLHEDTVHRLNPGFHPVWKLITVEPQWALHEGPDGNGNFWSSLVVQTSEEIAGKTQCGRCFPAE
jgi:hypothetical protein